ncbi:hypothetical protein SAMN05216516_1151, partial [Izhakiella capsodis]
MNASLQENNSGHTPKSALLKFEGQVLGGNEYRIPLTAENDEQLKEQVEYLFIEINMITDVRNCLVIDCLLTNDQTRQGWDDCAGCWQCESA